MPESPFREPPTEKRDQAPSLTIVAVLLALIAVVLILTVAGVGR